MKWEDGQKVSDTSQYLATINNVGMYYAVKLI